MRQPAFAALALATACSHASDRPYRLPYADNVEVEITADHVTHRSPVARMYDLRATEPDRVLVAAAPGWVREIDDEGSLSTSEDADATNNYVWIEHPHDWCQPIGSVTTAPGSSDCRPCPQGPGKCNEWTLYAHMEQNSVRGSPGNLTEGDWVQEGQLIGIESDVGFTPGGRHVHFTIFEIDRESPHAAGLPTDDGDYEDYVDEVGRTERVPLFCTADGLRYPRTGDLHIAGPC